MKKKTAKYVVPIKYFDTSKVYITNMLPNDAPRRHLDCEEHDVEVHIDQSAKDGAVRVYAEGYQDKWFYDNFFEWLLYTKYVKIKKD